MQNVVDGHEISFSGLPAVTLLCLAMLAPKKDEAPLVSTPMQKVAVRAQDIEVRLESRVGPHLQREPLRVH